jgi:hypothetical protein
MFPPTEDSNPSLCERLKLALELNHFALRFRWCLKSIQAAVQELRGLRLVGGF